MLGVTEKGSVTAMKKEGSGSLDVSSVEDMLEVGCTLFIEVQRIVRLTSSLSV